MASYIEERFQISPFLIFFVLFSAQFGIGFISFQSEIVRIAGQDAWIAVLITGIIFQILIWMMYQILDSLDRDIIQINRIYFGKWLGGILSFLFITYLILVGCITLRTFIELIQAWLFNNIQTWILGLIFLLLAYYIVCGGFRVIVGISFFSIFYLLLLPVFFFTIGYLHFSNLTPVFEHPIIDIFKAVEQMSFSFLGPEFLLICYPFIKRPKQSQKWAHFSNILVTLLYLFILIMTLTFCTYEQIIKEKWPTIAFYKFAQLPFAERFEFIGVSALLIRFLPILCLSLWSASRATKTLFSIKQYVGLPIFLCISFICICLIPNHESINRVAAAVSTFGMVVLYIYIPLLYIIHLIRKKVRKHT